MTMGWGLRGLTLAAVFVAGGCATAPSGPLLPPLEAAKLVVGAGLGDQQFTVDRARLSEDGTRPHWYIQVYDKQRQVGHYCFAPHTVLGAWQADSGKYEVYGRLSTLAISPHECRRWNVRTFVDIKGEIAAEDAAAVLDRVLAFAETRGASEPKSKITFASEELRGLLRDVEPGRLHAMEQMPNGESRVCFALPNWPGDYCFRLTTGAVALASTMIRCHPGDLCDESWMWNLKLENDH